MACFPWRRWPRPAAISTKKKWPSNASPARTRPRPRPARPEASDEATSPTRRARDAGRLQFRDRRAQAVREGVRQGAAAQDRAVARGEAVRAVRLRGMRPPGRVKAAHAPGAKGRRRRRLRARFEPPQGAARGLPARAAEDGGHAFARQGHLRPGPRRQDPLQGQEGQLHGAELRPDHGRHRFRDQAQGNRSRQRRRLGRAAKCAAATGRSRQRGKKVTTTIRIATSGKLEAALAALALVLAAPLASAQGPAKNAVESINFSQVQGGKIIVKVGLKEPLAAPPQGFAVTNPPRIAIDLPDTVNGLNRNQIDAGEGELKSGLIVQNATPQPLVV